VCQCAYQCVSARWEQALDQLRQTLHACWAAPACGGTWAAMAAAPPAKGFLPQHLQRPAGSPQEPPPPAAAGAGGAPARPPRHPFIPAGCQRRRAGDAGGSDLPLWGVEVDPDAPLVGHSESS